MQFLSVFLFCARDISCELFLCCFTDVFADFNVGCLSKIIALQFLSLFLACCFSDVFADFNVGMPELIYCTAVFFSLSSFLSCAWWFFLVLLKDLILFCFIDLFSNFSFGLICTQNVGMIGLHYSGFFFLFLCSLCLIGLFFLVNILSGTILVIYPLILLLGGSSGIYCLMISFFSMLNRFLIYSERFVFCYFTDLFCWCRLSLSFLSFFIPC